MNLLKQVHIPLLAFGKSSATAIAGLTRASGQCRKRFTKLIRPSSHSPAIVQAILDAHQP
jgi:hypothetical protein